MLVLNDVCWCSHGAGEITNQNKGSREEFSNHALQFHEGYRDILGFEASV